MKTIIFDIEASCEDKNINKNYNMETIEIGAVKVENGQVVDTFKTFIKPEYVQSLTPFCTELTGITYDDLKDAISFNEAIVDFYEFSYGLPIYSCGEFDRKFLTRELHDKGEHYVHKLAANAINANHRNLKTLFSKVTGEKPCEMLKMAELLNIEIEGTHHRALDDSLNLTKIFIELEKIREEKLQLSLEHKMDQIIDSINTLHSRKFEVKDKMIIEWGETKTFPEFLNYWSQVIFADHSEAADRAARYLTGSELGTLNQFKELDALEGVLVRPKKVL